MKGLKDLDLLIVVLIEILMSQGWFFLESLCYIYFICVSAISCTLLEGLVLVPCEG